MTVNAGTISGVPIITAPSLNYSNTCNHCGKSVNGGTYFNGVFYCPMCASIINKNNRAINTSDYRGVPYYEKSPCFSCPNNPTNGGSGICFCTLGSMDVAY